jgi:hypothetical protein
VHRARAEREILAIMDHPFLPTLYASFQVPNNLFFIDYLHVHFILRAKVGGMGGISLAYVKLECADSNPHLFDNGFLPGRRAFPSS